AHQPGRPGGGGLAGAERRRVPARCPARRLRASAGRTHGGAAARVRGAAASSAPARRAARAFPAPSALLAARLRAVRGAAARAGRAALARVAERLAPARARGAGASATRARRRDRLLRVRAAALLRAVVTPARARPSARGRPDRRRAHLRRPRERGRLVPSRVVLARSVG